MGEIIMKEPDGKYSTTDGSNMLGGDIIELLELLMAQYLKKILKDTMILP